MFVSVRVSDLPMASGDTAWRVKSLEASVDQNGSGASESGAEVEEI